MSTPAFYDDSGNAYYAQPDGGYGTTDPSPPAPAAGDWWTNAPYINQTPYKLNPNTGRPELIGTARIPAYLGANGVQIYRGEQVPQSVAQSMGVEFVPYTEQQFQTPQGGIDLGNLILNVAKGAFLSYAGITTGTPFIDKLLNGAIGQLVSTGEIDPEQLAKSAAIGQLTPEVAKTITTQTGLPSNIVNAATNVGVAGVTGGAPAALTAAAGIAGSEALKSITGQPGAAIATPTAESQPEYGTPTTPVSSPGLTGISDTSQPEYGTPTVPVTSQTTETIPSTPTTALQEGLSTAISPLPISVTSEPAVQPASEAPAAETPTAAPLPVTEAESPTGYDAFQQGVGPERIGLPGAGYDVVQPITETDQIPVLKEDGTPMTPEEVAAARPDLFPGGVLPQSGEDTTYFPDGGAVTARTEIPGQLSPGDQPLYDQETGRELSPDEVAAMFPNLYPGGVLPAEGQDTVFTPPSEGINIPPKTISQLFNLGGSYTGGGTLGAALSTRTTPSMEFGMATSPGKAMGEGDVESPETGKKRRQVWNVASLRNLQDALGI